MIETKGFGITPEQAEEAFMDGRLFEMQDEVKENTVSTILVPVTNRDKLENVVACPWFYVII